MESDAVPGTPRPSLSLVDSIALVVGVVVGAGIFRTPSVIAANVGSELAFLGVWVAGGLVSFAGALCYAELATTYPHAGGDYHFLQRAFGRPISFLFAWSRVTVIQTGSIALLAFVAGDYLAQWFGGGAGTSAVLAAGAVLVLTAASARDARHGTRTQRVLTATKIGGLTLVVAAGLFGGPPAVTIAAESAAGAPQGAALGIAMIFVLLTFGGWNEAAFLSAEVRNVRRDMVGTLLGGLALVTIVFLAANVAYLRGLGLEGIRASDAVAAELMRTVAGDRGAALVSALVAVGALGSANATIFTGARSGYALGRDFRLFRPLGRWAEGTNTPRNALLAQAAVVLVLIGLGAATREGFTTMVEYTAPVFWLFLLLVGTALLVLRVKDPARERPFRVPLYPLTPLLFCAVCLFMLRASVVHTGAGALIGIAVLAAGVPVLLFAGGPGSVPAPDSNTPPARRRLRKREVKP